MRAWRVPKGNIITFLSHKVMIPKTKHTCTSRAMSAGHNSHIIYIVVGRTNYQLIQFPIQFFTDNFK